MTVKYCVGCFSIKFCFMLFEKSQVHFSHFTKHHLYIVSQIIFMDFSTMFTIPKSESLRCNTYTHFESQQFTNVVESHHLRKVLVLCNNIAYILFSLDGFRLLFTTFSFVLVHVFRHTLIDALVCL